METYLIPSHIVNFRSFVLKSTNQFISTCPNLKYFRREFIEYLVTIGQSKYSEALFLFFFSINFYVHSTWILLSIQKSCYL